MIKPNKDNTAWLGLIILILTGISCNLFKPSPQTNPDGSALPPEPENYVAEVPTIQVAIGTDINGNRTTEADFVYAVNANMRYVLTFPWKGGPATIERVYTPYEVIEINNSGDYPAEELSAMMVRTEFPTSRELVYSMTFVNESEEGKFGYFEWPTEDGVCCHTGDVLLAGYEEVGDGAKAIYHIQFEPPHSPFRQTYIITEPADPRWGN